MRKLRISATTLDKWLYYKGMYNTQTAQQFADELIAPFDPTPKMLFGTAVGTIIETQPQPVNGIYTVDTKAGAIQIAEEMAKPFFDYYGEVLYSLAFEIKKEVEIPIGLNEITLVCKADALGGLTVYEHKTTSQLEVYDYYLASYQWRCYMLAFNAQIVRYLVAIVDDKRTKLKDFRTPSYHPYRQLYNDVRTELGAFVEFLEDMKIIDHFTPKI